MKSYNDNVVPANELGALRVHVRRAWNLTAMDRNGKSDPFVIVSINGHSKRSRVIRETLDPEWDEFFDFEGEMREFVG